MAGRARTTAGRHGTRRRAAVLWPAVLLLVPLWGCTAPAKAPDSAAARIGATLDRRAAAVLDRDERAYLAVLDPAATALRATGRREFRDLAGVPLGSWEYRLTGVERSGGRATVRAELRYGLAGYDRAPVSAPRVLELRERAGRWYVTADRPGEGGARQLWEQGPVRVVRGERALVLGVGQDDARLRAFAAMADRAVPAVDDAWPGPWARRAVLLVPASLEAMAGLLGAPAAGYRGIAAVTTGIPAGGSGAPAGTPADRIVVNPEAYRDLGDFGQRIVLTHETTHVATRAATSAATPTWLSEGFADWVAYRGTDRTDAAVAPELQRAVRSGDAPAALPSDEDFAFGADAEGLARAYEGGWLACELIAERWGERRLTDFYRAVGAHAGRDGAVEKALHDVLATTPEDFTARWRAYARERLG
ncbi:hypothetical protein ACFYYH_16620 [Streptomyces sp. NPDC002018]|uniref:hypothetical protein n=1 Tax=Streptomyces sp. NPDC002018 TaxID=3364629 RepID=UPI0036C93C09